MERNQQVDGTKWINVGKGSVLAPDTYVDIRGVLRSNKDDSCVVWHFKNCNRVGIKKEEIVYDDKTNAPWCPSCWNKKLLKDHFGK